MGSFEASGPEASVASRLAVAGRRRRSTRAGRRDVAQGVQVASAVCRPPAWPSSEDPAMAR